MGSKCVSRMMTKSDTSPTPNSLGFMSSPADTRVVVAMSGGVDSSVVAGLLAEQGYDVVGITLQLYDHGEAIRAKGACCAGADILDARRAAATLGIKHYVLDYESRFRASVMDNFADSYLKGETPVPCITCNQTVKFHDLLETARELGAACLATGHYVRRQVDEAGVAGLYRGRDAGKDQSYFLFATTKDQLDYLRFPLGDMTKEETRDHARRLGLALAEKPDSQDICFVPNGRYGDLVRRLRPGAIEPGDIVDVDGRILGRHDGVIDFTIGQRRGLGIGGRKDTDDADGPLYVVAIRPELQQVVVGQKADLACHEVILREGNWLAPGVEPKGRQVLVRLRNTAKAEPAEIINWQEDGSAVVRLTVPQYGIAAGQAAAIYDAASPDWLLGGGWIDRAPSRADVVANMAANAPTTSDVGAA